MIQSRLSPRLGLHVAIIMDGNGRWATARGRPRTFGHRAGADVVRRTVEVAPSLGIRTLTLYAFSSDNWKRPSDEVSALLRLLAIHLRRETPRCLEDGVRISVIGRRDRLPSALCRAIETAEAETAHGKTLELRIAVDYSARDAILRAVSLAAANLAKDAGAPGREEFSEALGKASHATGAVPDVDLLIRTGGELRLSDFLLWECAYAELVFLPTLWPDFGEVALEAAIREYHSRARRFGGVGAVSVEAAEPRATASARKA